MIIKHSNIHPTKYALFPNANKQQPPANGNVSTHYSQLVVHSISDFYEGLIGLPTCSPEDLLGMTFICQHNGKDFHTKVIHKVLDHDAHDHQQSKVLLSLGDSALEEPIAYNELSDLISKQSHQMPDGTTPLLGFSQLTAHQAPLQKEDPHYKGSSWNVYVH